MQQHRDRPGAVVQRISVMNVRQHRAEHIDAQSRQRRRYGAGNQQSQRAQHLGNDDEAQERIRIPGLREEVVHGRHRKCFAQPSACERHRNRYPKCRENRAIQQQRPPVVAPDRDAK
jgi:hypothetical protein